MIRTRPSKHARAALALALAAAVASAVAPASAAAGCAGASAKPASASPEKMRSATLCLINRKRTSSGHRRLRNNSKLHEAAAGHSNQMVERKFFSHTSPNGDGPTDRIRSTGYLKGSRSWATGENIGWGAGWRAKPKSMVRAWMDSPVHRALILSDSFRQFGVGIARGAPVKGVSRAATYTVNFGRR